MNEFVIKNGYISKGDSIVEGGLTATTISATTYQNLPSSPLTVGTTPIVSGTSGGVLFQSTGNTIQQDTGLFWDNTNKSIGINATPSDNVLNIIGNGTLLSQFSNVQKNNAVSFVRDVFGQTQIYITSNDTGQKSHAVIQRGSNQNRLSINTTAPGSSQTTSNSELYLQNHLVITQHDFNVSTKFGNASTMPATSNGQGVLQMLNGVAPTNNITDCFVMYSDD
jgi:hypothetical protein